MSNIADEKRLNEASGGTNGANVECKYKKGDIVKNDIDWVLRIEGYLCWDNIGNCPSYRTTIVGFPDGKSSFGTPPYDYKVGENYNTSERYIVSVQ